MSCDRGRLGISRRLESALVVRKREERRENKEERREKREERREKREEGAGRRPPEGSDGRVAVAVDSG